MKIINLDYVNEEMSEKFNNFLATSPDYEPYYTLEKNHRFKGAAIVEDQQITAYIGLVLINDNNNSNEASNSNEDNNSNETNNFNNGMPKVYELSALTSKDYRKKGYFNALLSHILGQLSPEDKLIMPINEEFKNISCVSDYLYSEYLYVLKKNNFLQIRDELEKQSLTLDHYTAFTEDHTSFYLYLDNEDATCESDEIYGIDNEDISILNAMLSEDDEPAAMLNLSHTPSYSTIYGVFVDEDKRNKGLGFSLLFDTLDEFFKEYDKPLILNVTSTNIPALNLYKKAGFIKTSQVDYYAITSPMS